MSTEQPNPASAEALLPRLLSAGLLLDTGVRGVFGYGARFLQVIAGVQRAIDAECAADAPERVQFPPLIARDALRRTGYMEGFPQLLGCIQAFAGDEHAHEALLARVQGGETWGDSLSDTELALTPACCYPLYPTLAGSVPEEGRLFDLTSFCFRREPSDDPVRMQGFQMRENVRIGPELAVHGWWERWMQRGEALLQSFELPVRRALANDPFFGRGGRLLKASQREQGLKYELVVEVSSTTPTALASFNCHRSHFTGTFGITLPSGELSHSACVGFGLERVALALFATHGLDVARWPAAVRARLLT